MTKKEFLARCETIWKMGLAEDRILWVLMRNWLDFVMRFEHTWFSTGQTQGQTCIDFLRDEQARLGGAYRAKTLANDEQGYKLIQIAAVFSHHCQKCAEDVDAWHTRSGFCPHRKDNL